MHLDQHSKWHSAYSCGGARGSLLCACRIPPGYPSAPAELRLRDHEGLSVAQQRLLSKQLHAAAAGAAGAGEVCCFDLVEECRSFLQEHNIKRAEDSPQASL